MKNIQSYMNVGTAIFVNNFNFLIGVLCILLLFF